MDKSTFDAVINFGIEKEYEAEKLYRELSQRPSLKLYSKVFEELAQMEVGHAKKLEAIRMEDIKEDIPDDIIESHGITDYMNKISADDFKSYYDVLVFCAQEEEKAVKLYQDMASKVNSISLRNLFISMADEEKSHKLKFEDEFDNAKGLEY